MTNKELVTNVSERSGFTKKDVDVAIYALVDVITEAVDKGESVKIAKLGTFEPVTRAARTCINPRNTAEKIEVPEKKCIKFKPSASIKNYLCR